MKKKLNELNHKIENIESDNTQNTGGVPTFTKNDYSRCASCNSDIRKFLTYR